MQRALVAEATVYSIVPIRGARRSESHATERVRVASQSACSIPPQKSPLPARGIVPFVGRFVRSAPPSGSPNVL